MKYSKLFVAALAASLIAPCLGRAQVTAAKPVLPAQLGSGYAEAQDAYDIAVAAHEAGSLSAKPSGAALVIPRERTDAKDLADTEEDLNVMARILAKAAAGAGDSSRSAMGITIRNSIFGSSSSPQNLYLEGYGALFFLSVNYPLVAPPARSTDSASKDATSSEWEEARRELYQPRIPGLAFSWSDTTSFLGEAEAYDSDKVDQLKTDLITALKNAVHIRKLRADETVTVVVAGRTGKAATKVTQTKRSGGGGSTGSSGHREVMVVSSPHRDSQKSELIIRAKRSDIEAFQKDKIDLDEFRKRVTVMSR